MNIKKKVAELDKMVEKGKIIEAFETFFHDNVRTHSDAGDESVDKTQKLDFLKGFFGNIKSVDEVKLHKTLIDGSTTYSKFTFKFMNHQNENLKWHEIIRRIWVDDLVIDEYYFNQKWDDLEKQFDAKKEDKPKKKDVKQEDSKKKEPKKEKVSNDDLKKVEGIGPKIEQILHQAGILTYSDLSKAKAETLKQLLTEAGNRFKMHDPTSWGKQAKLLKDGKLDELQKLQDELKGGKVVS